MECVRLVAALRPREARPLTRRVLFAGGERTLPGRRREREHQSRFAINRNNSVGINGNIADRSVPWAERRQVGRTPKFTSRNCRCECLPTRLSLQSWRSCKPWRSA